MEPVAFFPDTNILLHYPPIEKIDWTALAKEPIVKLVICLQVVKELNRKKDDPRLSDRAKRAIKDIKAASGKEIRPGVLVEIFNQELRISDFPASMSPDSDDDRIVFQVHQYLRLIPTARVAVVTEDLGMELRCAASGVTVLPLPNELRLPDPQSDIAKRHQQITAELDSLKSRLPELSLRISESDEECGELPFFTLEAPQLRNAVDEMRELRTKYSFLSPRAGITQQLTSEALNMNAIPASEYTRYNTELEEFFSKREAWISKTNEFRDLRARTFLFNLWLVNDGAMPGEDIDLTLFMHGETIGELADDEETPLNHPPMPSPPEKPKGALHDMLDLNRVFAAGNVTNFWPAAPVAHDGVQWTEVRTSDEGFALRSKVKRLKHHHRYRISRFRVTFRSWADVGPFQSKYTITAANHPQMLSGTISFVAKVDTRSPSG
jgi:hypothetical protein